MKEFYENKTKITWMYRTFIVILIGCIFYLYFHPLDFKVWICTVFFVSQVLAARKILNSTKPYAVITPEFLKVSNKTIPWKEIRTITIQAPISLKFNTKLIIKCKTSELQFDWGVFTEDEKNAFIEEIEKYKSIIFIRCSKNSLNSGSPKTGFIIWIILFIVSVLTLTIIYSMSS